MLRRYFWIVLSFGLVFVNLAVHAQTAAIDTNTNSYFVTYPKWVVGRFYFSQKYTSLALDGGKNDNQRLKYYPNTTLNMGVGVTYESLTLNLAYGFPFLQKDDVAKGKTKYLDLQSYIYPKKWSINFFGQFYRGYYADKSVAPINEQEYYIRPDLMVRELGLRVFYLSNYNRFSFRAAVTQNEWQQRSAGTWMYGANIHYGIAKADSSIIPASIGDNFSNYLLQRFRYLEIGPGIGYAHTFVWDKRWFITASGNITADIGFGKEDINGQSFDKVSMSPNLHTLFVLGYNNPTWQASVSWVNTNVFMSGYFKDTRYTSRIGNVRLTIAKRFSPGKQWQKPFRSIDKMLNR